MKVSVQINISLPEGIEIVHYLEKYNSIIVIENELSGDVKSTIPTTYSVEEPGNILHDISQEHYETDLKNRIHRENIKTVSVQIDVSSKEGQELLRELEKHSSVVVIDNLIDVETEEINEKTYSAEYAENLLWEKINKHFGIDNPINEDESSEETFSAEEIEKMVWDKLSDNYGIDVHKL